MRNLIAVLIAVAGLVSASAAGAQTLDKVKQRGFLSCGGSQGVAGFSAPDATGIWKGFDVDLCRAVAAAIFDDPSKFRLVPLSSKDRFTALQSGEIDMLVRTTTWTLGRDVPLGLTFTATNFYDGQGFLVKKSAGIKSAKELNGASVCTIQGTTSELNLADYARINNIKFELVTFQDQADTEAAFNTGRCDSYSTDRSGLAVARLKADKPDDLIILPETISKEPDSGVVRKGDGQWFDIVRWTFFVMVDAEELGITQANVKSQMDSTNPETRRLLGKEGNFGEMLGLSADWGVRILRHVGNYGESFERNIGSNSPLKMERGLNQLWSKGGIQYAPPIR